MTGITAKLIEACDTDEQVAVRLRSLPMARVLSVDQVNEQVVFEFDSGSIFGELVVPTILIKEVR